MSALDEIVKKGKFWAAYLAQSKYWLPNGKPCIAITDMDDRWRRNAAAWLLRRAETIEMYYTAAEMEWLYRPMYVVIGEVDGKPVERLDPEAHMGPTEGSMAADAYDQELETRRANPQEWLQKMLLYKALLEGLDQCDT